MVAPDGRPSGEQYEIAAAGYRAVVTEAGAGLRVLEYDGQPLVAGYPADQQASAGRGQLLLPWPNRIADGRYTFEGRDLQLPITEVKRGHAIHGLTRWTSWRLLDHTEAEVLLGYRLMSQPGYPWTLDLSAGYALSEQGLTVTVTATNLAPEAAPFAAGAHPYTRVVGDLAEWQVTLSAGTALTVDERLVPNGRTDVRGTDLDFSAGRRIGTAHLDTAFTDLGRADDGRVWVHVRGAERSVDVWMDEHHRWVQLFTGPEGTREALAVEPMTAPPNAFRSGEDLAVLAPAGSPGDSLTVTWGIRSGA